MSLQRRARVMLRRRGIEVSGYRWTVAAQRQQMFGSFGVDLLVDIGANVGQYAQAAREAGYAGRLLSVEPLAAAHSALETRTKGDPSWHAVRSAVGAKSGTLTMNVSEGSIFSSALSVLPDAVAANARAASVRTEEVPMLTLDELLADQPSTVLAVKIDVQGFERDVLEGAEQTLKRARMVELELSPNPVYEGQMLMDEALGRMADAGFTLSLTENLLRHPSGRCLQFNGIFVRVP